MQNQYFQNEENATHKITAGSGEILPVVVLTETNDKLLVKVILKGTDFHDKTYKVTKSSVIPL